MKEKKSIKKEYLDRHSSKVFKTNSFGKFIKIIIMLMMLFNTLNFTNTDVYAAPTITKSYHSYWLVNGGEDNGFEIRVNGKLAYCVEPLTHLDPYASYTEVGYNDLGFTHEQNNMISLISYYGNQYLGRTDTYWEPATQTAIWSYLGSSKFYVSTKASEAAIATESQVRNLVSQIMKDVNAFFITPSFHGTTITLKAGETYTFTDYNNVLSEYDVITTGGLEIVSKSGNTLIIKATKDSDDNATIIFRRNMSGNPSASETVLYYYNPASQNLMIAGAIDPQYSNVNIQVQKTGYLDISKVNENDDLIDGSQFKIVGANYDQTFTLENGRLNVELDLGNYTVQEVSAPDGYLIDNTIYNVTINAGETTYVSNNGTNSFVNAEPTGTITLIKKNTNGDAIVGGEYGIFAKTPIKNEAETITYYNADALVSRGVTDSNGQIIFTDLHLGDYYIKEIKAPDGYLLDTTIYNVTLSYADETTSIITANVESVEKEPTGTLTGLKVDSETGNVAQGDGKLGGATYALIATADNYNENGTVLYNKKGTTIAKTITNENGVMDTITNIPVGKYILKELNPSTGYLLDTTEYPVNITYEGQNVSIISRSVTSYEPVIKGKLKIFKTGTIGLPGMLPGISNVRFEVKLQSEVALLGWENAKTYATLVTDTFGFAETGDLPFGVYILRETSVPENYIGSDDIIVDINVHNEVEFRAINNRPFQSWLRLVKTDGNGNSIILSNATFKLYTLDEQGNKEYLTQKVGDKYVTEFATNNEGYVQLPYMLDVGTYYVEEVVTPDGFLTSKDVEFYIGSNTSSKMSTDKDGDPVTTVNIVNEKPTGTIELIKNFEEIDVELKTDLYAKFKVSAVNEIIDPANGEVIYGVGQQVVNPNSDDGLFMTDETLHVTVEGLPMGLGSATYLVEEVETNLNYNLSESFEVTFEQTDTTTKTYAINQNVQNKATVTEISKTDITGEDELVGAHLQVVDKDGNIVDEWISTEEKHLIKGLERDETYTLIETLAPNDYVISSEIEFTVNGDGTVTQIHMIDKQVAVSKTDITGEDELVGAKLTVIDEDGIVVDEWTSTTEAHYISGLEEGKTYVLIEEIAPDGYVIASQIEFTVSYEKETELIHMIDKQVAVSKTDITGEDELEGAKLTVIDQDGNVVDEWTSTTEVHYISGLEEGRTYILIEEIAPDGYVIASQIEFTVSYDKETELIHMIDKIVEVTKTDFITSGEVEGAELIVTDEDGNIIDEWVSSTEPHYVSGLEEGKTYILIETLAPYGYYVAESIEFTVTNAKETQKINMQDEPILSGIKIRKVDSLDETKVLKQAEFTLYDSDMEVLKVLETDDEGLANFEDLRCATYYLKETKAPTGYKLSDEVIEIIIDENYDQDHIHEVTVQNTLLPATGVNSGDNSNSFLYIAGGTTSLVAIAYLVLKKKQKEDEETSRFE